MPNKDTKKIGEITDLQKAKDLPKGREGELGNREEVIGNRCNTEQCSDPITYSLLPITCFKIGDRVTVKSIPARALLLGKPTAIEIATYPSLIGVVLTIESIEHPWIICTRASGTYAPALLVEDLVLVEGTPND